MPECPACGESFETDEGVGKHHSRMHPDEWEDMFWYYVDKDAGDGCWEWIGRKANGYGSFIRDSTQHYTHRLSYKMHYGVEPDPQVNHHCDNPPCVNPDHLYRGTQKENAQDAWNRSAHEAMKRGLKVGWENAAEHSKQAWEDGKMLNPEDSSFAKLTREQAKEIKYDVDRSRTQKSVAQEYGVSANAISSIWLGKTWSDV